MIFAGCSIIRALSFLPQEPLFMFVIAVINRKGGCGKSTLATHLAAHFAGRGASVMLGDVDRQQSTRTWLKLRETHAPQAPRITSWMVDAKNVLRPPPGVTHAVLDTPGGLSGLELARVVMVADAILMPLCESVFDRDSASQCLSELRAMPRIGTGRCRVAAVGMRLERRTRAASTLEDWAREQRVPFVGALRDSQNYVRCIERGLTLFDTPSPQLQQIDLPQWKPILGWLDERLDQAQKLRNEAKAVLPGALANTASSLPRPASAAPVQPSTAGRTSNSAPPAPKAEPSQAPMDDSPGNGSATGLDRWLGWIPGIRRRSTEA
jgi:chromosome partitioning protein